jgi:hypothetical protein
LHNGLFYSSGLRRPVVTFPPLRFVVRADEKLTAFVELERAIYEFAVTVVDNVA